MDVQHGRGHAQGAAVPEPEVGPDPGADREVGVGRLKRLELVAGEVADPEGGATGGVAPVEARGDDVVDEAMHLVEVGTPGQGQVQRHPGQTTSAISRPGEVAQLPGSQAVPLHAGQQLQHVARVGLPVEQRAEILGPADRVDHAPGEGGIDVEGGTERAPRGEHQQVSGEAGGDLGQLLVGAHGEGVAPQSLVREPLHPAGEPAESEAVPVALRHRHQPGRRAGDLAQVGPPALAVDVEGQAHLRFM